MSSPTSDLFGVKHGVSLGEDLGDLVQAGLQPGDPNDRAQYMRGQSIKIGSAAA